MSGLISRIRALWYGTTGTGAAASIGLALLVFACTFVGVAVPRASLGGRTDALQRIFSTAGPAATTVTGNAELSTFDSPVTAGVLDVFRDNIASVLHQSGLPLAGRAADWSAATVASDEVSGTTAKAAQVELAYRDALPQDARLISGSLPDTFTKKHNYLTFAVAVTQATAKTFGLHVGSVLALPVTGIGLRVTGIVRPIAATSPFWTTDPLLAAPEHAQFGGAFVGPDEIAEIVGIYPPENIDVSWGFPLVLSHVNADQVPALQNELEVAFGRSQSGPLGGITLSSGLVAPLAAFITADEQISAVLALLFVSLTAIGLIVILLGARLLSEYRTAEFTVLQARGASVRQVAWLALRGGSLVAIPAAIVAVAVATALTPGVAPLLQWQLTAATLAVALAGPPVITGRRHQALRGRRRGSNPKGRGGRVGAARRWVFDIAVICAAAAGLLVLRQLRPPAGGGGLNFFTSAAPVLVAIPAAIIVMRLYPVALRWLLRRAGRRGGVTIFVGLARGARTAVSSALPVFALVLALALIGFGATLRGAIGGGEVLASWQLTGADAVIQEPAGSTLSPALQRSIAAVPGVRRTATAFVTSGATTLNPAVPIVEVSPAQYAALVAGTSAPAFPAKLLAKPAGGKTVVPVLVTPGAGSLLSGGQLVTGGQTLNIRVAGTVPSLVGLAAGSQFVVVPAWSVPAVQPNVMAVVGARLDDRLLTRLIQRIPAPAPGLELRAHVLRSLETAPLPRSGYIAFAQGAAAAGGFCVLILLLSMVLGARSRRMTLARLATMGMSRAQSRRLSIVETVPAIVAAALGGAACVIALVPLLAPAISLSAFTGSPESVPVRDDPAVLAVSVGALLLLALLTIVIQAELASRRQASSLRVGE